MADESRADSLASSRREEHAPLLRGRGRYLDDIALPGTVHLAFVRSPHAHARVLAVDAERARAMPGVVAVLTGADLHREVAPVRPLLAPSDDYLYRPTDWHPVARERVRYAGEIVAAVAAVDRYRAEDAAVCVDVDYEALAAVTDAAAALAGGAPRVHPDLPDNLLYRLVLDREEGRSAFEKAPVHVRGTWRHPRVAGLPMENCGVLARFRGDTGELEIWSSTQVPHLLRDGLSRSLGLPAGSIRVIAPHVGGGFGTKMQLLPEELIAAFAARRLGRPVKWVQDRMENLYAGFHARDATVEAELAADGEGRLLGLRARALFDVGAYNAWPLTCALEPATVASGLPGPYRMPWLRYEGCALATHKYPGGAYRGVGFPLGPLVMEGLLDRLAHRLGQDPAAIRRRNLVPPAAMPFASASGAVYDSGDYPRLLEMALAQSGYESWRERAGAARGRRRVGVGIACFVESTGMNRAVYRRRGMVHVPAFDAATLRVGPDGHVLAALSTPSQGQSQHSTFRHLLAGALGLPPRQVSVHLGDTATSPYGSGTFASRSVVCGGGALLVAARKLREKLVRLAAAAWGIDEDRVSWWGGAAVREDDPGPRLTLAELAGIAHQPFQELPPDLEPGLEVHAAYDPPQVPFSAAAHVAAVEVDTHTGKVRVLRYVVAEDCGPMLNPKAVEGQLRGGVAQGIGSALYEQIAYDADGQQTTSTLLDYLVPGSCDVPPVEIVHMETPSPFTEGGLKGVGESGTIGAPAAITGAVLDALGVEPAEVSLPLTPERLWRWLEAREGR